MVSLQKPELFVAQKLETMTMPDEPFLVVESHTIEKPYGWVFFCNRLRGRIERHDAAIKVP